MAKRPTWLAVAGARPNFVKLAPLVLAAKRAGRSLPWVHTGQHYDECLSGSFLRDLALPPPVAHLGAGSGGHSEQTARVLSRLAPVLAARRPDVLVVLGDVNSTLAAALAGVQAGIPVVHVEAGLRSFDASMPEERNRVLVDHMSERLYVTEPSGVKNLRREGIAASKIRLVGNVMIDALRQARSAIRRQAPPDGGFALVTLHRPSNVDDRRRLAGWCRAFQGAAQRVPVLFAVHPRTADRLKAFRLEARLDAAGVLRTPPLGYFEFLGCLSRARVVLTDSGGIQEEAAFLGVPCLTLRSTTERPMTVERGTNRLVGDSPERLLPALQRVLRQSPSAPASNRLWDGRAARRIVTDLISEIG